MAARYPSVDGVAFKDVLEFPGYCIGDDGSPWSRRIRRAGWMSEKWRRLKTSPNKRGYGRVVLCRAGIMRKVMIHQLVLEAFVGPCPPGMECRHLDGNPRNNRLGNLAWGTKTENRQDQFRHGTALVGGTHPQAKIGDDQVAAIIERLRTGDSLAKIGSEFGVTGTLVRLIGMGLTRQSVPRNGFVYRPRRTGRKRGCDGELKSSA
jgi:hypothetical protein